MEENLYLIEIIYLVFYLFVFVFAYFNVVAILNFSQSNKIIVENSSPQCSSGLGNLPLISLSKDAVPCVSTPLGQQPSTFFYNSPKENLTFIITKDKSKAGFYKSICSNFCSPKSNYNHLTAQCSSINKTSFENCNNLLEPPPNCSNNSMPVAIDKDSSSLLYAIRYSQTPAC